MPKSIIFNLGNGDLSKGFSYSVRIEDENNDLIQDILSLELKANTELESLCDRWRSNHRDTNTRSFKEIIKNPDELPRFYGESDLEVQYRAKGGSTKVVTGDETQKINNSFETQINQWLANDEFDEIIAELKKSQQIHKDEEIRCIIRTKNNTLKSIPWHLWKFFDDFPQAEIAFSTPKLKRVPVSDNSKEQLNVLAILGNDDGINLEKDREFLNKFAETEFLIKPSRIELEARLRNQEQSIDILFFAGHSKTEAEKGGIIHLNDTEELEINALKDVLQLAISNGLQLAIFNSCDGLGIADELAKLQIPQVIVMRELVPNLVAQEFLKRFLDSLSHGFPFYSAFRISRNALKEYEDKFPFASWLPVIFQNQTQSPLQWKRLGLDSIIRDAELLDNPLEYLKLNEYEKDLKSYSAAYRFASKTTKSEDIIECFNGCSNAGEKISLVDGLIANSIHIGEETYYSENKSINLAIFIKIIEDCRKNSELENLLALTLQALGRIEDKDFRHSITCSSRLINELCEIVNSESSNLLIWSAAMAIYSLDLGRGKNISAMPADPKSIADRIVLDRIRKFGSAQLAENSEYEQFKNFWLYGPRHKLRCFTSNLDLEETYTIWRKKYNNNVRSFLFDLCWKITNELKSRAVFEERALLKRVASQDSNAALDNNKIFQGILLDVSNASTNWVKHPSEQVAYFNYRLSCLANDNNLIKKKALNYIANSEIFNFDLLKIKCAIDDGNLFSVYMKDKAIVIENKQQELLFIISDLEFDDSYIINHYFNILSVKSKPQDYILNKIQKFDSLFKTERVSKIDSRRFKKRDFNNKPINIHKRILTKSEFSSISIIINNIELNNNITSNLDDFSSYNLGFGSCKPMYEYHYLIYMYDFVHTFFKYNPDLYNFIKTNKSFIKWKNSIVMAIKDYYKTVPITIAYREIANNSFKNLVAEIKLLIEKEIAIGEACRNNRFTNSRLGVYGVNSNYYRTSVENIEQDLFVQYAKRDWIIKGAKEILNLKIILEEETYFTYISNLKSVIYRQKKIEKYQEYFVQQNVLEHRYSTGDRIQYESYENDRDDYKYNSKSNLPNHEDKLDWSQASKFWLPSVLLTLSSNLIIKVLYPIAKVGYELLVNISIIRYSLWTILAFSVVLFVIIIVNDETIEKKSKGAFDTIFSTILVILASLLILSIILFCICSWFVCLNEFTWLFDAAIANGNFIYRFLGVSAIVVTLLINYIIYTLFLSHFWKQSYKKKQN